MHAGYDCIVVGAGPAGLNAACRVIATKPGARVLVLEKSASVGGRTQTIEYGGQKEVACGAGIGRVQKDRRLAAWVRAMGLPLNTWTSGSTTAFLPPSLFTLPELVGKLKAAVRPSDARRTFRDFAQSILTPSELSWFLLAAGFTDYCKADAWETVMHYGFDDVAQPLHGFSVPWNKLAQTTLQRLKKNGVKVVMRATVTRIVGGRGDSTVYWQTSTGVHVAKASVVIVATAVPTLRTLFPLARPFQKNALEGQPFVRLFATLNEKGRAFMERYAHPQWTDGFALVEGPLQKVGIMNRAKGVYRLGYADNQKAIELSRILRTRKPKEALTQLIRYSFGAPPAQDKTNYVKGWRACEWFPVGTHYYPPLPSWASSREAFLEEAQRPLPGAGVWVVGEAVSRDQGWTEGALQSIDSVWNEVKAKLGS